MTCSLEMSDTLDTARLQAIATCNSHAAIDHLTGLTIPPPPRVNTEIGVLHSSAQTRQDNHRLTHIIRCIEVSSAERQALTWCGGGRWVCGRGTAIIFQTAVLYKDHTEQ